MTGRSPWGEPTPPNEVWERWYAWRPVIVETDDARTLTCWEEVWRRRDARGKWEYRFLD